MLRMRLLSGLVSAVIFPFLLLMFMGSSPPGGQFIAWAGMIFLYLLPIFLLAGTPYSLAVDNLADAIHWRSGWSGYLVKLALYAVGGFVCSFGLYALTPGWEPNEAAGAGGYGVLAGIILFHVWLFIGRPRGKPVEFHAPEPIETERLRLVPCTPERLQEVRERGYPVGSHIDWYLRELRRDPTMLGWGTWLVQLRDSGVTIGDAGFKGKPDMSRTVEIGYGFLPSAWGKGYGTETAKALVEWAFTHGASRVTAETERSNSASIHVLQKVGFTRLLDNGRYFYWQMNRLKH